MKRELIPDDHPYRSFLVPYDRNNPDPRILPELIKYIESRQSGLTQRDIEKLDEIEWFTFNTYLKTLAEFAVPGIRIGIKSEVCYVKRFDDNPYWKMLGYFLDYLPKDFPADQAERCFLPGYRLSSPENEKFYPIKYNGDLPAWRKRMRDNAEHFLTLVGHFDHGRFKISDGREIEFAELRVDSVTGKDVPLDY